jgi:hypothetical protein
MSVNMDIGVSVPAEHFGAAGLETESKTTSRDLVRDLKLGLAMTLGVVASCSLSVLVFLT